MTPIEQLEAIVPALTATVDHISLGQLEQSTPCADFDVHDVIDHMIVGGTTFAALFRGEQPGAVEAPAVHGRVPAAEFRGAMEQLVDAVRSPGALERTIPAPFGDVPGETFARFVALDGLIHGWDLARASGRSWAPSEALVDVVDEFARVAITPELRDAGLFAAPTAAPPDADAMDRLAAFTGRVL